MVVAVGNGLPLRSIDVYSYMSLYFLLFVENLEQIKATT